MKWIEKFKLVTALSAVAILSSTSFAEVRGDNTKLNQRDTPAELTADQQKNMPSDMEITRLIRQDLMQNDSLSDYAHNIKIITVNGKVTLKGPVRSKNEIKSILKSARSVAGVSNIINQITIVPK